jgi:hypothetical protein
MKQEHGAYSGETVQDRRQDGKASAITELKPSRPLALGGARVWRRLSADRGQQHDNKRKDPGPFTIKPSRCQNKAMRLNPAP